MRSDAFAGVERHVAVLAAGQAHFGHEVRVIGGDPDRMARALGSQVIHHPARTTLAVARRILNLQGAHIVHVHMTAAEVAAALASPSVRAPIVSTRHFAGVRGGGSSIGRIAGTLARQTVAAQIAISEHVAAHVDGPSTVIYPGVSRSEVVPDTAARRPWVLVAQRLEKEKNTEEAVRAFAVAAPPGWSLVIAGDGTDRGMIEGCVRSLGLAGSVTFLGHREDVVELMSLASVLLAPCATEGLGLSVVEAMGAGLPVVAADGGGHQETVGRSCPENLYPPGDWRSAADRLRALIADPAMRTKAAEAGRAAQASTFAVDTQLRATDEVYRAVLS